MRSRIVCLGNLQRMGMARIIRLSEKKSWFVRRRTSSFQIEQHSCRNGERRAVV